MKYIKKYEEKKKGKDVVHTLKTKAKSSGGYEYDVHILEGDSKYSDETNGYSYNGLIISIDTTPGSWYLSTFLHYSPQRSNTITIDGGSNWTVTNGFEIEDEVREWIKNEYPYLSAANKYNL